MPKLEEFFPPWKEKADKFPPPWLPSELAMQEKNSNSWFQLKEHGDPCLFQEASIWGPQDIKPKKVKKPKEVEASETTQEIVNSQGTENVEELEEVEDLFGVKGVIKVRLYPTPFQAEKLKLLLEANRYAWNDLAARTAKGIWQTLNVDKCKILRYYLQKTHLESLNYKISTCPDDCFDSAFREFKQAAANIKAASAKQKDKTGKGFAYPAQLKFKKKKEQKGYIDIRARSLTYNPAARTISFYRDFFGRKHYKIAMKTDLSKLGITKFQFSSKLCLRNGHYYLMVPHSSVREFSAGLDPPDEICALDPGVRTFLTGYNPSGSVFEISPDQTALHSKKNKISHLQSCLSQATSKKSRAKLKLRITNLYRKIKNCVNDLHHKSAKILADSYQEIIIPEFRSSEMVEKEKRKIGPTTTYGMLTLGHYKFRQILQHKMNLRGTKLVVATEEYSSKTCGGCKRLNYFLNSKKIFVCPFPDCSMVLDRDVNGARNIYIMNRDH